MSDERFVKDHSYLVNYDKYCILDKVQHKHLYLDEVCEKLNEQQYLLKNQNELLDEICTIFKKYGIETGYNKRILEVALENLTNGDDV